MIITRRQFISALAAFCCCPLLQACKPTTPLSVAIHHWIGYEPIFLARGFNWLPSTISLHETNDLSSSTALLQTGQFDAACLTLDEVLRLRATGIRLTF